jgi:hypothetical protein
MRPASDITGLYVDARRMRSSGTVRLPVPVRVDRIDAVLRLVSLIALALALVPIFTSKPFPLKEQPFPDTQTYEDTAFQIAMETASGQ